MQNPILSEYQRTRRLGAFFVLLLSFAAATVHFLLTLEQRMELQSQRLAIKALHLDAQLLPLQKFADSMQQQALLEQADSLSGFNSPLYTLDGQTPDIASLRSAQRLSNNELHFLSRSEAALNAARTLYPWLDRVLYWSDQDLVYLTPQQLSLLQIQTLQPWLEQQRKVPVAEQAGLSHLETNKILLSRRLRFADGHGGWLIFVIDSAVLLEPFQKLLPGTDFFLLDEHGKLLGNGQTPLRDLEQRVLQLQRIGKQPLSLVMLEQRQSLFGAGLLALLTFWLGYLLVLSLALWAFLYRYRQKTLQPVKRLTIHIERLLRDQGGVRHIPRGWEELFDKINRLKP